MKVQTSAAGGGFAMALEGAHEVAWATMLDLIYADAFHRDVGELSFVAGHETLLNPIQWRADASITLSDGAKSGLAWLVTADASHTQGTVDVLYTVSYGVLAPRLNRRHNPPAITDWTVVGHYSVFTWKARAYGIPIRLAGLFNQPHRFDYWMHRMRKVFVSEGNVPAFYHLKIWTRTVREGMK